MDFIDTSQYDFFHRHRLCRIIKVFEGTTDGYIYDLVSGQVIHALIDSSAAFN
ncbi:hypothetical protein [Selenomonas montiformis]|uniref:hypothetical protein n=1 Tax=Selenomonas montiformis TaxID=2652285 RepID=UPI0012B6218C|nr:hypothetical protein [Selenomonas montiformis]